MVNTQETNNKKIRYDIHRTYDDCHRLLTYVLLDIDVLINTGNYEQAKIEEFNRLRELRAYLKEKGLTCKNNMVEALK